MPDTKGTTPASITVDFTNVGDRKSGGKAFRGPEGDYLLSVNGAKLQPNKDGDGQHVAWSLAIVKPERYKNSGLIFERTSLKDGALWKLRNMLEDMGLKVSPTKLKIPLADIVAKKLQFGATLADGEPYNGKIKSEIVATFKKSEYQETSAEVSETTDEEVESTDSSETEDEDESLDELDVDDL